MKSMKGGPMGRIASAAGVAPVKAKKASGQKAAKAQGKTATVPLKPKR